nr:hypothetical protein [Klebsiella pneumoniae]
MARTVFLKARSSTVKACKVSAIMSLLHKSIGELVKAREGLQ